MNVWIMLAVIVSGRALDATVLDKFLERVTRPPRRPWNWRRCAGCIRCVSV
jgi:hypothetical protein